MLGAGAGLVELRDLPEDRYVLAVRGDLLATPGRVVEARTSFERAAALAPNPGECEHLLSRAATVRREGGDLDARPAELTSPCGVPAAVETGRHPDR